MPELERPKLADDPAPLMPTPRRARSDFQRRFSYYLSGVAIGVILVIPIMSAKCQARKNAQNQPGQAAPTP